MANGHCPLDDCDIQNVQWTFQFVHWTIGHFSLSTGRLDISVCPLEDWTFKMWNGYFSLAIWHFNGNYNNYETIITIFLSFHAHALTFIRKLVSDISSVCLLSEWCAECVFLSRTKVNYSLAEEIYSSFFFTIDNTVMIFSSDYWNAPNTANKKL